ncbi:ABC transporter permease subunit [Vibrio sp. SCSIO 43136]|uniref:ABC transporter permease subunit n=1 Tax=Vibrio sp. SCSIO 43136 TaxID=2819101 RepID=UPI002074B52F|nr:ABC transporter permease subunit [Vibrio sp. SCSIO 43136]USD65769.1 ABC transporter permease subunit [Vibrio sp. SCSIO 43136]
MSHKAFLLQRKDKARRFKDGLARAMVTAGGVSVLAALGLIFLYLFVEVIPVFSSGSVKQTGEFHIELADTPAALRVDDYGRNVLAISESGSIDFVNLSSGQSKPVVRTFESSIAFAQMPLNKGWVAFADQSGKVSIVKPGFDVRFLPSGREVAPSVEHFNQGIPIALTESEIELDKFTFAIDERTSAIAGVDKSGYLHTWVDQESEVTRITWLDKLEQVQALRLTPNAEQLFVLVNDGLWVAQLVSGQYQVREFIDLAENPAVGIELLAGAQSLLISHKDGQVSQWFDVLKDGERKLTQIRQFDLDAQGALMLSDHFKKDFYLFRADGSLTNMHTTSHNQMTESKLFSAKPSVATVSSNEDILLTYMDGVVHRFSVDYPHPEISFRSLWRSVWYEGYPEPQYVWQSTSASDSFEEKFSIVPITFGTIKAALFAMVFAMPIAVLAAVYTAYFMSTPMRRVVKPAIEIMEALPTVIIGFLAGLWLAPIVETNLPSVLALVILLPLSTVLVGAVWFLIPAHLVKNVPNGWHSIILIPIILVVSWLTISLSADIEGWFFGGDIRVYLANIGIDFDQRNALVVGLAMGFAVIPTIFTIAEDAIYSVPKHLTDGSLALGATHWQTLTNVVLLTASPGIFSAVMMGLGRAVGETMIVLMATGNTPLMDWNIFEGMRSLSATIAIELPESEVASTHYRLLFLAALILFIFTFLVNSIAESVRQRLREKYSAL